jgi:hypothetical protein
MVVLGVKGLLVSDYMIDDADPEKIICNKCNKVMKFTNCNNQYGLYECVCGYYLKVV